MPYGALPMIEPDGSAWPIPFAARILEVSESRLRREVKNRGIQPSGELRMADFRRSGRNPRAYPATELITIAEEIRPSQANREEK